MGHHDSGWWGVALAIVAIVLAFPISIFANWTTPAIKNWWSQRSMKSLLGRIERLEQELANRESREMLTEFQKRVLLGAELGRASSSGGRQHKMTRRVVTEMARCVSATTGESADGEALY